MALAMKLASRRWGILWFALLTLLGLGGCAGARNAEPASLPPQSAEAKLAEPPAKHSRGIFYEVRGAEATVFLLGSVHVGKRQFYPLDPPIEAAFEASDTLVLEVDLRDKERLQQEVIKSSVYPRGDDLEKHLDPVVLTLLREYFVVNGVPFEPLRRLKPWTLTIVVVAMEFKKAGFEAEHGIDVHFAERAQGKAVMGIETVQQQMSLFTSMDDAAQNLMLQQVLEEIDQHTKTIDAAAEAWLAGDEQRLDRELLEPMRKPEYRELFERLFLHRNVTMTRAIESLLKQQGTHFVVVGAGHVIGKQGIVDLLRSRGYSVERR
jgi:uncharacterized protein YbaP (TraB family)